MIVGAQWLPFGFIPKHTGVSFVWENMVNHSCPCSLASRPTKGAVSMFCQKGNPLTFPSSTVQLPTIGGKPLVWRISQRGWHSAKGGWNSFKFHQTQSECSGGSVGVSHSVRLKLSDSVSAIGIHGDERLRRLAGLLPVALALSGVERALVTM